MRLPLISETHHLWAETLMVRYKNASEDAFFIGSTILRSY